MNEQIPRAASAANLLARYSELGIPHFQRGLVWNTDSMSLLLESLYYGTPCGNILLWRPFSPQAQGIPLERQAPDYLYMILDGQQRIRSLYEVFGNGGDVGESDEEADVAPDAPGDDRIWCMDVSAEPSFAGLCERQDRRRSLFVYIADPRKADSRYRINMLPLDVLLAASDISESCSGLLQVKVTGEELARLLRAVQAKARAMLTSNLFSTIELHETDGTYTLADVVRLYNRINSGGRRVEAEEKAFATLVRLYPKANDHIRMFFQEAHGVTEQAEVREELASRDEMLKRRKESRFGFKLFIRTFAQVCNYHFGRSCGTSGFSFDILDSPYLQDAFARPDSLAIVESLFTQTARVLVHIRKLLRDQLFCDDLRMLPDTAFFPPVVHLLTRFPKLLDEGHDRALAYLILRLALKTDYTQAQFLKIVGIIDRSHNAADCVRAISHLIERGEKGREELFRSLRDANSLNNRYVLLLYWLVRKSRARDLSYTNLPAEKPLRTEAGREPLIEESIEPEKQHLVPASFAGRVLGSASRIKTSSNKANNIGNLTYISHRLNCLEGLGDIWVDPEKELDQANTKAHFLHPSQVGDCFQSFVRDHTLCSRPTFEQFCDARRGAIAAGFAGWIEELKPKFVVEDRMDPARPHFTTHRADRIRDLGYPDAVEDMLLELLPLFSLKKSKQAPLVLALNRRRGEPDVHMFLYIEPKMRIELEDRDGRKHSVPLRGKLAAVDLVPLADCPDCRQKHQPPRWVIYADDERVIGFLCAILAALRSA